MQFLCPFNVHKSMLTVSVFNENSDETVVEIGLIRHIDLSYLYNVSVCAYSVNVIYAVSLCYLLMILKKKKHPVMFRGDPD